ncbi:MAG: hypothetical protein IJQ55_04255 [Alphaproteobacteria bacterium]|nr:hypothetical protein [Alphaproteobacteria bacterium]
MYTLKRGISWLFCRAKFIFGLAVLFGFFVQPAHANIIDAFNLSPFVPLVLDSMMTMATSLYRYFVGNGTGIIYILVYAFLGGYLVLYLVKIHLPKDWLGFLGFSGGGEMWDGSATGWSIAENVAKPCLRAIIAIVILLQIKPVYVTEWLVNPFLEFGAIYSESILTTVSNPEAAKQEIPACPESIAESGWISKRSCEFLVQPIYIISKENNRVIKYGFGYLKSGLRGLMLLIPRGGENLLNIITGILLISAFVSSNVFMALLMIQAIFDFCLALIMYPFNVLVWVAKKSDKWFDVLPAFSQIIEALKKLVITMIACSFILCVNIAIVRALFHWSSSSFVVAAGGVSTTNTPTVVNSAGSFGQHSLLWLSSILTIFVMLSIFKMTQERLGVYTKGTSQDLYNNVKSDSKIMWGKIKSVPEKIKNVVSVAKKLKGGK